MAHRALVAYRDGDRYTLHYAHWGDGLAEAITPDTPFGGRIERQPSPPGSEHVVDAFALDPSDGYTNLGDGHTGATRVDPRPLAREIDPEAVLAAIDQTIESLVAVEPDFTTRTYAVCPLGVDGGAPLVVVGPIDDAPPIRQTLRTVTERLGERVDRGDLDAATARRVVRRTLERHAPVHPLDDASFLRTD